MERKFYRGLSSYPAPKTGAKIIPPSTKNTRYYNFKVKLMTCRSMFKVSLDLRSIDKLTNLKLHAILATHLIDSSLNLNPKLRTISTVNLHVTDRVVSL